MTESDYDAIDFRTVDNALGRLPQNLTVTFKDPQWAGHWFNKKAGSAKRVGEGRALGFVPAKVEDLEHYFPGLNDQDGALEDGDLVLMKIHKAVLYSQVAMMIRKAKMRGSTESYKREASSAISPRDQAQEPYYFTPQAEKEFQGVGPVTHLPEINR
jgi:hypothetical protein